ncbi:MAG: endo-1,4-beta-xylanase [Bacteroidota bacterium]
MEKTTYYRHEIFIIAIAFLMLTTIQVFSQPLASGYNKFIGNVFDSGNPPDKFELYWNQVTPGNAGKWMYVEPQRGVYSWSTLDIMYQYCIQRGVPFKYHCLIWAAQQPAWITTLDSASQAHEVEEFIRLVGERYPQMSFIDVVNEPLPGHNQAEYRNALGGAGTTGWDWVITAFRWARQYCAPGVKLILNDFGIINSSSNTDAFLIIINLLKERGLIDGIGVQGHRFELEGATTNTIKYNLDRLAATGLPIYISEFDVAPNNIVNDTIQLTEMQRVLPVLWTHPGVKGITFWGYLQGSMWQTGAYLVRSDGTERPALQWLRNYLTAAGSFRSHRSGRWDDIDTWERYDGSSWITPALTLPSTTSKIVSVESGDTVTVAITDSIDQLWISQGAGLVINPGKTLTVQHGDLLDISGADMFINGFVNCSGTLAAGSGASILFGNGSSYLHEQNGGVLPQATWGGGSVCILDALTDSAPTNGNQNFYNIIWNSPGQTDNLGLGWKGNTIDGTITILNTGSGRWNFCNPVAGERDTININGDIVQSGGQVAACGSEDATASVIVNHTGDIDVTGGSFSIARGSGSNVIWNLDGGNVSIKNAATQNDAGSNGKFVFCGNGVVQALTLSGVTYGPGGFPIEVDSGAILNIGTSILGGEGNFRLQPGAIFQTGHAGGLDSSIATTGISTFSTSANYTFNGLKSMVTGSTLPDTVARLTINCSQNVTLSKNLVVNEMVEMKKGHLLNGGNVLTYGPAATLKYSGFMSQTTSDNEFPVAAGPKDLIAATENGLILHSSRTIGGTISLQRKMTLGANSLTASSTSDATPTAYVVTDGSGVLKLTSIGMQETLFPVGMAKTYAPVWISNAGIPDTLGVNVASDTSSAPYGGRVNACWKIDENSQGGGNYTLRFGWSTTLENALFSADRSHNARIFLLSDMTEAGTGAYTTDFSTAPYSVSRGGITTLGLFGVGRFGFLTDAVERNDGVPKEIRLVQNYPNPFNPTTVIVYELPSETNITLAITNVLGVKIRTLVDTRQSAGKFSAVWDGTDDRHRPVATGIYFYTLSTNGTRITKKMLLMK